MTVAPGPAEPGEPPDTGTKPSTGSPRTRPELADEVLVARAAGGDPRAFEVLVRRHERAMYRVALRITGRRDDADDATQNAFIAAWRRLPEFRGGAAFATWMYRIVTNHALNQVKARRRSDQQADLDTLLDRDQPSARDPGPERRAEADRLLHDLRAALDELSPDLRIAWYARVVDGYSYQEVGAITGVAPDTARARVERARARLATRLEAWR